MHVRVLASIAAAVDGRPVALEFFGDRALLRLPETIFENFGDIGKHLVGQRMAAIFAEDAARSTKAWP